MLTADLTVTSTVLAVPEQFTVPSVFTPVTLMLFEAAPGFHVTDTELVPCPELIVPPVAVQSQLSAVPVTV